MTGRLVADALGVENLRRFGGRFTAPVWPGDTLTSTLTVVASSPADDLWLVEVIVRTVNQDGVQVFTGTATAAQQVPPATS